MAGLRLTDEQVAEAVAALKTHGNLRAAANALGIDRSTFQHRIHRARADFPGLIPPSSNRTDWASEWAVEPAVQVRMKAGTVLVGSDLHIWPGPLAPAYQAFVAVALAVRPDWIVLNGDMIDGARISRHARQPFSKTPKIMEEIDALRAALALLPEAKRFWCWGNHDNRAHTYLAHNAAEMEDYAGTLADRFPDWPIAWALVFNDAVEIRHRFRGGIHAAYNNALHSGLSCVTGDTHQLSCRPIDDRRGRRYGVETGMLGDPLHPAFQYAEAAPSRVAPGFALLTFRNGVLLPPELAEPVDGRIWFRGEAMAVAKPRYRVPAGRAA